MSDKTRIEWTRSRVTDIADARRAVGGSRCLDARHYDSDNFIGVIAALAEGTLYIRRKQIAEVRHAAFDGLTVHGVLEQRWEDLHFRKRARAIDLWRSVSIPFFRTEARRCMRRQIERIGPAVLDGREWKEFPEVKT